MDLAFIFSSFFCSLEFPALHIPLGFSQEGNPIGVQLIGNQNGEENLFEIGRALEDEFKGWVRSQPFSLSTKQRA